MLLDVSDEARPVVIVYALSGLVASLFILIIIYFIHQRRQQRFVWLVCERGGKQAEKNNQNKQQSFKNQTKKYILFSPPPSPSLSFLGTSKIFSTKCPLRSLNTCDAKRCRASTPTIHRSTMTRHCELVSDAVSNSETRAPSGARQRVRSPPPPSANSRESFVFDAQRRRSTPAET